MITIKMKYKTKLEYITIYTHYLSLNDIIYKLIMITIKITTKRTKN